MDSRDRSPMELEKYVVWKEGATPTPNRHYKLSHFKAEQPEFAPDMPTTFRHYVGLPVKESVPGVSSDQSQGDVPPADPSTQMDDPPPEGVPDVRPGHVLVVQCIYR